MVERTEAVAEPARVARTAPARHRVVHRLATRDGDARRQNRGRVSHRRRRARGRPRHRRGRVRDRAPRAVAEHARRRQGALPRLDGRRLGHVQEGDPAHGAAPPPQHRAVPRLGARPRPRARRGTLREREPGGVRAARPAGPQDIAVVLRRHGARGRVPPRPAAAHRRPPRHQAAELPRVQVPPHQARRLWDRAAHPRQDEAAVARRRRLDAAARRGLDAARPGPRELVRARGRPRADAPDAPPRRVGKRPDDGVRHRALHGARGRFAGAGRQEGPLRPRGRRL
mmetsp:Transcript_27671/g.85530  ORF Transcript_27671/g.85530 Transcript_27671/m.85530 type:complete len:284 (+) Transcript_27671:282-1133(+)